MEHLPESWRCEKLIWLTESFCFMDGGGLWIVSQVCKEWRTAATSDDNIWITALSQLYNKLLGRYLIGSFHRSKAVENYGWRQRWAIELREIRKYNKSARLIDNVPSAVLVSMFSLLPGWFDNKSFNPKDAVRLVENYLSVARTLSVIGCVSISDVVHKLDTDSQTVENILESLAEYSPHTHISCYRQIIKSAMQSLHCFFLAASTSFGLDDTEDKFDCAHDIQMMFPLIILNPLVSVILAFLIHERDLNRIPLLLLLFSYTNVHIMNDLIVSSEYFDDCIGEDIDDEMNEDIQEEEYNSSGSEHLIEKEIEADEELCDPESSCQQSPHSNDEKHSDAGYVEEDEPKDQKIPNQSNSGSSNEDPIHHRQSTTQDDDNFKENSQSLSNHENEELEHISEEDDSVAIPQRVQSSENQQSKETELLLSATITAGDTNQCCDSNVLEERDDVLENCVSDSVTSSFHDYQEVEQREQQLDEFEHRTESDLIEEDQKEEEMIDVDDAYDDEPTPQVASEATREKRISNSSSQGQQEHNTVGEILIRSQSLSAVNSDTVEPSFPSSDSNRLQSSHEITEETYAVEIQPLPASQLRRGLVLCKRNVPSVQSKFRKYKKTVGSNRTFGISPQSQISRLLDHTVSTMKVYLRPSPPRIQQQQQYSRKIVPRPPPRPQQSVGFPRQRNSIFLNWQIDPGSLLL